MKVIDFTDDVVDRGVIHISILFFCGFILADVITYEVYDSEHHHKQENQDYTGYSCYDDYANKIKTTTTTIIITIIAQSIIICT